VFEPERRVRRRKCRRPRFASEAAALRYARVVLREERTAYSCSAHESPVHHLRPKSVGRVLDTPTTRGE